MKRLVSEKVFARYKSLIEQPIESDNPYYRLPKVEIDFTSFPNEKAVSAVELKSEQGDGSGFFILTRINSTWRSSGGPNKFAIDSDPTWILSALGPKVASFLGFRLVDDRTMLTPNAQLFNKRLEILNSHLVSKGFEPITVRWLGEIGTTRNPDGTLRSHAESYLREGAINDRSPFQLEEVSHDTAHHALDILVTNELKRPQQARDRLATPFADFMRSYTSKYFDKFPLLSQKENREAVLASFFLFLSITRDNFSGNIPSQALAEHSPYDRSKRFQTIDAPLGREFFNRGNTRVVYEEPQKYTLRSWLQIRLSKPNSGQNEFILKANHTYTLKDWLSEAIFNTLEKAIFPEIVMLMGPDVQMLTRKKLDRQLRAVRLEGDRYNSEMQMIYKAFIKANKNAETVLVSFNSDFSVKSGLAPRVSYAEALRVRAAELEAALEGK